MERRQSDRNVSERLAVMETQYLNSAIMFSQIKQEIHEIMQRLGETDKSLEKRVADLERSKTFLSGAWFALTMAASFIIYLQGKGVHVF